MKKQTQTNQANASQAHAIDELIMANPYGIDTFRIVELELFTGIKQRIDNVVKEAIKE